MYMYAFTRGQHQTPVRDGYRSIKAALGAVKQPLNKRGMST